MKPGINDYNHIKTELMREATVKFGTDITLCGKAKSLFDSFTIENIGDKKYLIFHFNYKKLENGIMTDGWSGSVGRELKEKLNV